MKRSVKTPWQTAMLATTLLAAALWGSPLAAQSSTARPPNPGCPAPQDITPAHLHGVWRLSLGTKPTASGSVIFTRHPEFADSVRGALALQAANHRHTAMVAGDATAQGFQLEESADGTNIDAVWTGDVSPDNCGQEIKGWRRVLAGNSTGEAVTEQPFVLRKTADWR
ncbi:MAG TPA: hypothetical protein VIN35_15570 [Hydrogenophaga sp.]